MQQRIVSAQAGAHLLGTIYAIAPVAFMLFMRAMGGAFYSDFYGTALGQLIQVFIVASGLVAWWLTRKVARRGLYLDGNTRAPQLRDDVHLPGYQRETPATQSTKHDSAMAPLTTTV
ncbi:MAG: hypothetical protein HC853_14930 [Anaerolineae bacterium]|nr:hypothetical protein [Anaerolineae bacterium]